MQEIKMMFLQRSHVFKRYLLSYLLVCLLPLSIFFCVVYSLFTQAYEEEVLQNALVQMSQTRLTVDTQLEQISNIANQVFTNKHLKPFSFSRDNMAGQTAREELTSYLATNSFVKELILYPGVDEYLFSSTSSYTMDRYIEMNQYASVDRELFLQWMTTSQKAWVRPAEDVVLNTGTNIIRSRYVLFMFPDPIYRSEKARKLLVVVEEQKFKELMRPGNEWNIRHGVLLDKQGNVIVATDPDISMDELLAQIPEGTQATTMSVRVDDRDMIVLYQRSTATGWKYLLLIDRDEAMQNVLPIRTMILITLVTVFVLGLGLIVMATIHSYKPVRELVTATAGITTLPQGQDEFEYVRQGIDHLHNRNLSLTNEMENSSEAIREYLLYYLLKGQIPSVAYFNEKGNRSGLSFQHEAYGIVIFYAPSMEGQKDITTLGAETEKQLPQDLIGYARSHNESNHLLLICNFMPEQYDLFIQAVETCRGWLAQTLQRPVTAGYSIPCATIDKLPNAYIEALTALDYRFLKGQNTTIAFTECTVGQSIIDQSLQNIPEKLTVLIENGDQESIENLLSNVSTYIKRSKPSIFVCKMVCFDIINTVLRYTNQHLTHDQISEYPNVFMIASFETFDELVEIIKRVSSDLLNAIRINQTESKVREIDKMIGYIHEHCSDCGFSIGQMADDFGVSASALSQYFKDHQGTTVLEYASQLRMEKAKALLKSAHMPLQDVALEVGYYNVASFIRRFKQMVGCTPGEYRARASSATKS